MAFYESEPIKKIWTTGFYENNKRLNINEFPISVPGNWPRRSSLIKEHIQGVSARQTQIDNIKTDVFDELPELENNNTPNLNAHSAKNENQESVRKNSLTKTLHPTEDAIMFELRKLCEYWIHPLEVYNLISKVAEGPNGKVWIASNKLTKDKVVIEQIQITHENLQTLLKEVEMLNDSRRKTVIRFIKGYLTDNQLWLVLSTWSNQAQNHLQTDPPVHNIENSNAIECKEEGAVETKSIQDLQASNTNYQENEEKSIEKNSATKPTFETADNILNKMRQLCEYWIHPLEEYNLISKIGSGAYGNVWIASNNGTKDKVAIKQIDITEDNLQMLLNEVEVLNKYRHKTLVKFINGYLTDNKLWLVMEYLHLGSLAHLLKYNVMTEGVISRVSREILQGIEYLHERDIVHRDIKSDNIVFALDGNPKIVDFGFCKILENGEKCNEPYGTPHWMAPEVFEGRQYDKKADIWSFGITVIEMIDRRPPYIDIDPVIAHRRIAEFGIQIYWWNNISNELKDFLDKCLQIDSDKRFTAKELLDHPFVTTRINDWTPSF